MPFIYENGTSREVTQEEFVAWAKANGLPVPSVGAAQPGLSKDDKDQLQREKEYQNFQRGKLADLNQQAIDTQKQIELAKANGASDSELEKLESQAQQINQRIVNRQDNLKQSESESARLEKIDKDSKNPPLSESVSTEDANKTDDTKTKSRLEEIKDKPPQEIGAELKEGSTVQQFDDGSSLETFPDGSTFSIDAEGNVKTTPPKGNPDIDPAAKRKQASQNLDGAKDRLDNAKLSSQAAKNKLDNSQIKSEQADVENTLAQENLDKAKSEVEDAQAALDVALAEGDEDAIAAAEARLADAQTAAEEAETAALEAQIAADTAKEELNADQDDFNAKAQDVDDAQGEVDSAQSDFDNSDFSGETNENPTNADSSEQETEGKYADGSRVPDNNEDESSTENQSGVKPSRASAQWAGVKDLRVVLRVPSSYLDSELTKSLKNNGGILFPYTPSLSYEGSAAYGNASPLHSNFPQYFFKNSSVSNINLSGKFTVQNQTEAKIWLSIVHLGRALTKMPFGDEPNRGSAPPVCRLDGFGNMVFANVPVAVVSFKFDLPDTVDYIAVYDGPFINSAAPTISTITMTLQPMYSREEIRDFTVEDFLKGSFKGKGYL